MMLLHYALPNNWSSHPIPKSYKLFHVPFSHFSCTFWHILPSCPLALFSYCKVMKVNVPYLDTAAGGHCGKMFHVRNFYLLTLHLGLLFSHLHLSWSHNTRPRLQKFCHTMSSRDSPLSACTASSNPPTGTQISSALLLSCPACLRIPLGTPAAQDLRGTAGTIIMVTLMFSSSLTSNLYCGQKY